MLMLGSGSYAMVPPFNQRWCGHPLQLVDGFDDICQVDFIVCSLLVLHAEDTDITSTVEITVRQYQLPDEASAVDSDSSLVLDY